jgi:diguanylate cyclase (GGDEF)-like protein
MNRFDRKIMAGLAAVMVVFLAVGFFSYKQTINFMNSSRSLIQNHQVLEKLLLILQDISDAKSGQRDFIITGQESFLAACQNSLFGVNQKVRDIRDMIVKDDSSQAGNLENLNFLLVKEINFMTQTIETRRDKGLKATVELIQNSSGAETMDDLHQLVWNIQSQENTLLQRQTEQMEAESAKAQQAFMAGFILDAGLLLLVYLFVHGEINKRNRIESKLGQTTDILQSVLENMVDAVLVADTQGKFLLANPAAKRLTSVELSTFPTMESAATKLQFYLSDKTTPFNIQNLPLYKAIHGGEEKGVEMFLKSPNNPEGLFLYSIGKPLKNKSGEIVGGIGVYSDITDRKNREGKILQDNSRLKESVDRLEQYNREISLIAKLVESLQACLTVSEVAKTSAVIMSELFHDVSGGVFIINNSKTTIEMMANFGPKLPSRDYFSPDECWAMRRSQAHHVDKDHHNMICHHFTAETPAEYICIPLAAQGSPVGLFNLSSPVEGRLGTLQRKLAVLMGEQVALAIANLQLKEALKNQSIRDPLTNLFNRRYLEEAMEKEMARAERGTYNLSVLMLDIDHFKQFNDKFGHEAGDRVLWEVGSLLNKSIRKSDIACRYGGEELIVLLPETDLTEAKDIAEKIRLSIKELKLTHLNTSLGTVTASIGVSSYPIDGHTGIEVQRQADIALYNAKSLGRDRVFCWRDVSSDQKKILPHFDKNFVNTSADFKMHN